MVNHSLAIENLNVRLQYKNEPRMILSRTGNLMPQTPDDTHLQSLPPTISIYAGTLYGGGGIDQAADPSPYGQNPYASSNINTQHPSESEDDDASGESPVSRHLHASS